MEKYLFRDGTNVTREVESRKELQALIQSSADPAKIRIWIFLASEWITLADFNKRFPIIAASNGTSLPVAEKKTGTKPSPHPPPGGYLKKLLIAVSAAGAIILIYNFTKVTWRKTAPLTIMAPRPANTPPVDMDSLIGTIELLRGQKMDKVTRTNLRIRNNWPDLLLLKLNANRDTSREGSRFYDLELVLDNATGYRIDDAVVQLDSWKAGNINSTDTVRFVSTGYSSPAKRKIGGIFRCDSIIISFSSIRAKAFNFCYSSDKKSNYGNYNDRWYCRD